MSQTIYDFDEKNAFESIQTYYFNDGYEINGFSDNPSVYMELIEGDMSETALEIVKDAFVGEETTYLVFEFTDKFGQDIMYVLPMSTSEFKTQWSERVWAKFRADMNDTVCPECGQRSAHMVAGMNLDNGERREQFFCDNCGNGWIGHPNGEFIKNGVLKSQWDVL